jgi:peptidoglycan/LPS O-acetylase OafA/YrhL
MNILQPALTSHSRHVRSLTSLRFFAALWVLALHFTDKLSFDIDPLTGFFEAGRLGVDFFFILSGFILTHVYLDDFTDGRFRYSLFLQRRLARIYPLHFATFIAVVGYVTVGWLMGISFTHPQAYAISEIPANLLLVHGWGLGRMSWNYLSWSVSAEWFAYLLFPLLTWLLLRQYFNDWARLALALGFLAVLYLLAELALGRRLTHLTVDFSILRILPEFILGAALYHLSLGYDLGKTMALPITLIGLVALAVVVHYSFSDFISVILLGYLVFTVSSLERLGKARLLCHPRLVYLGEISYSIYMVHGIVLIVYFKFLQVCLGDYYQSVEYWVAPGAILLTFMAAAGAYRIIEVPCRSLFGQADLLRLISTSGHMQMEGTRRSARLWPFWAGWRTKG